MDMSLSSNVHGGHHHTKFVTFELLMYAALVADEIWGFMLETARNMDPAPHRLQLFAPGISRKEWMIIA